MTMILKFSAQILCCVMLVIVPLLLGTLGNLFIKEEKNRIPTTYVTGLFALFLVFEGAAIVALKLDLSFSMLVNLFSILLLLICGAAFILGRGRLHMVKIWKEIMNSFTGQKRNVIILCILLGILFAAQIVVIFHFSPMVREDNTMEIIQTTLTTNGIHTYNAMTGQVSANGITMQGKFMVLPLFYAYMCRVFQMDPGVFLYRIVPVWILMLSYLVYIHLAEQVFKTEDGKADVFASIIFVLLYSVLLLFGDFLFTTIPYRIFHCAWAGETVVVAIILPFLISQCMRFLSACPKHADGNKNEICVSILQIGISGITVFILVSLQKGITYLTLTGIMMLLVFLITKVRRPKTCKNS